MASCFCSCSSLAQMHLKNVYNMVYVKLDGANLICFGGIAISNLAWPTPRRLYQWLIPICTLETYFALWLATSAISEDQLSSSMIYLTPAYIASQEEYQLTLGSTLPSFTENVLAQVIGA